MRLKSKKISRKAELGLIHPPVGMNVFGIKSVVTDVRISTIFYGVLPFVVTDILPLGDLDRIPHLGNLAALAHVISRT